MWVGERQDSSEVPGLPAWGMWRQEGRSGREADDLGFMEAQLAGEILFLQSHVDSPCPCSSTYLYINCVMSGGDMERARDLATEGVVLILGAEAYCLVVTSGKPCSLCLSNFLNL